MVVFNTHHPWVFVFGILVKIISWRNSWTKEDDPNFKEKGVRLIAHYEGNIISFVVYLAPIPTFFQVCKKRSTENFQSLPYVVALFSSMLWIYYALLKIDAYLLLTINSIGCFIEIVYIAMFLAYAPRKERILTTKLLLLLNLGLFLFIFLFTFFLAKGSNRIHILGWVCVAFSAIVFVAPLSIMRLVIRTKSVEFMPFFLSLFLTLSSIVWFAYGLLLKDLYVYLPNILGFISGVLQMILYLKYNNRKKPVIDEASNAVDVVIDVVRQAPEHEQTMGS